MSSNYLEIFSKINTFIFDVDGVMTDGRVLMMENGEAVRRMNIKDGYVLQLAVKLGYNIAIITGGNSEAVKKRFNSLGIYDVYLKAADKMDVFEEYKLTHDIDPNKTLYMGDDIPDYQVMKEVAMPCCPTDAAEEIKQVSKYISSKKGGEGCVRDVMEKVLKLQNKWMDEKSAPAEANFKW